MLETIKTTKFPHLSRYIERAKDRFGLYPLRKIRGHKIVGMGDSSVQIVGKTSEKVIRDFGLNTRYNKPVDYHFGQKFEKFLSDKKYYPNGNITSIGLISSRLGADTTLYSNIGMDKYGDFIVKNAKAPNLKTFYTIGNKQRTSIKRTATFGKDYSRRAGTVYTDASLTAVKIPPKILSTVNITSHTDNILGISVITIS